MLMALTLIVAAGCGGNEKQASQGTDAGQTSQAAQTQEAQTQTEEKQEAGGQTSQAAASDQGQNADNQQGQAGADGGKIVVYFSRVGNSDFPADTDAVSSASLMMDGGTLKGNAQKMAEWIADEAGCSTFEIQAQDYYPADYDETVDQAKSEQGQNFRPALKTELKNLDSYDTIYLVFPNWWADLPMPVYTFFDTYDLSGKKINVFITHEGSGFSRTVSTIEGLEPDAEVTEALAVRGGSVPDSEVQIREWVSAH